MPASAPRFQQRFAPPGNATLGCSAREQEISESGHEGDAGAETARHLSHLGRSAQFRTLSEDTNLGARASSLGILTLPSGPLSATPRGAPPRPPPQRAPPRPPPQRDGCLPGIAATRAPSDPSSQPARAPRPPAPSGLPTDDPPLPPRLGTRPLLSLSSLSPLASLAAPWTLPFPIRYLKSFLPQA